jgi:polyisoprenoid-binding protein YceI
MPKTSRPRNGFTTTIATALACAAVLLMQGGAAPAASAAADRVRAIDPGRSWLKVYVGKEGLFAFAGDAHQVDVPIAAGSFNEETNVIELTIDAAKLRVLDPPSRQAKVQANMLGPQVLDVAKYPTIAFRSTSVSIAPEHLLGDAQRLLTIEGELTLHGQTHPVSVRAQDFGPARFTGSARFKQSAFGITPIKVAGGAVRVKDDVDIVFEIDLK